MKFTTNARTCWVAYNGGDFAHCNVGHSVGRWEGDTLIVDVVGFNDKTWIAGAGTFHSEALHVVERFTRVDKDQINYEATVEDPNVLTKPWVLRTTMMLREGTRVEEYVCAENNVDVERLERLLKERSFFRRELTPPSEAPLRLGLLLGLSFHVLGGFAF